MISRVKTRVTFGETDRMGVAYYGRFFDWFIEGMMDYYRSAGIPYLEIEKKGIRTAIVETHCEYKSPAYFDDVLEIRTRLEKLWRKSVKFAYEVVDPENMKLHASGYTVSVFLDENFNPVEAPRWLVDALLGRT